MFAHGLLLLFEMADREDERFQLAAARWHARFVLEAKLPLREAETVMTLLCWLRGADRLVVRPHPSAARGVVRSAPTTSSGSETVPKTCPQTGLVFCSGGL